MNVALSSVERIDAINQAILETAARPLSTARALPAAAYTDADYFAWEISEVLSREWLAVAHVSQIPKGGDYVNLTLLGERLSVVRGTDGTIRVLSRVCAHRGMDVMPPETGHAEQGNCRQFQCPYHHWVYDLDGRLKGAPFMKDHAMVAAGTLKLHTFRSEVWEGFVFVNFSADAQPLVERYAGLLPFLARWRMDELVMVIDQIWDCPFNWKVLVENFMEPYHHAGAHHRLFQPLMPAQGCWTEAEAGHYTVCHLPPATCHLPFAVCRQPAGTSARGRTTVARVSAAVRPRSSRLPRVDRLPGASGFPAVRRTRSRVLVSHRTARSWPHQLAHDAAGQPCGCRQPRLCTHH
jgi:nitrite reductase/ring-hydroxylating ferredoxin subunit